MIFAIQSGTEDLTHLKRPWCWERLRAGGEGDDRGWDCWMASPTQWAWVWVSSRSWWWTGRPGMLWFMGLQRVGMTERLNWTDRNQPWVCMCPPSWNPLPFPSPFHPSGLPQYTGFECPVLRIELGLVIYFTRSNIHVSMLFSQIILLLPSPTESKSLFFIFVSLCCRRLFDPLGKGQLPTSTPNVARAISICIYNIIYQFSSVTQLCPPLCDPMNCSTPGPPVHHQLPEFTQTHVHRVGDAIQPSHPLSSPSPSDPNPSQHQGLLQWVNSSHEVAKVLEFQLQHQSFQWTPRTNLP